MAVSYSSVTQPALLAQQYPPALLPKPGKDNARLQKLLKKSAKKKAAPQTIQTPAPFRSSLSPVNEASADLEHSDHSTPPKTPETPSYASQPPRFSVRPLYQHVSSPYPQQRGISYGRRALFSPQPFSPPANVHPPYFYSPPPPHAGLPVVPGSVTQAVTTLTPGPTSSVSKITMPTVEMRIPAPIPVVETVSHTIIRPTTVISPLMKPRSPRPTFKASLSRSPKPMFEVPQIQMYTANTYEVIKTPLHDSTGLSAIGGTTTQRRTPTSELRRGLTPTSEVKRVLTNTSEIKRSVTPTLDVKRGLTPTSQVKRTVTPTLEVKRGLTPTSEVKRALTPTSEVKRALTPTSEIKRALTPTSEVKRALTPTSEIKRSLTPTSDVKRGLTPTSEILRPKTPTYDSSLSRTSSGRPKTPSYHVTRSKTPVFEISRPNPLLFAVSPITTETQRSKSPSPVSPTSPATETEQSNELVNAKNAATPNGVISLHENVSKPDAPRPETIEVVKSTRPKTPTAPLGHQRPKTPTAPLGHQRPKTPTAPLGHQRPKTPTNVSPKPTTTSYGYQRPRTPSYESHVTPTYGYQRPKTPLYEGPKPPTPATQTPKTLTYEPARPPIQSLRNQRPKTLIYGTSPQVSPSAFQRPKTPTHVAHQPKSTYYGLTPAEYVAHGGIQSYTPSFGLSRSKTPTQEESKNTAHASEESNTAQQETVGKTQPLVEETHKEDKTILKQEVTPTPAIMVPTIVVSQASDATTVSSHEPQIAETPRVQPVLQETPKVSAPETKIGIKTPAKKTEQSPVPDAPKPKTPITGVKPPILPPANINSDSNKAPLAKDAKQTAEKVHGTVTKISQQSVDTKEPPKIKAPIKQIDSTKMVETVSTTSTPIEKDSATPKAVTESPMPIKQMDTNQDKVKPVPTLVPSTPPSSASETKDTGNDLPAAEPLLKVIKKPKGMKSKLSGWSRLKKHMVVEVEEPKFPETECQSEAKKEDGPKISETKDEDKTAVKASEKSGSNDGDESEPPKPKTIQMWDAVLFQMFSTKENIMQQIEASKSGDEKEDLKDVAKEVPAFAHRLPVLLFSPRFDAKRLREAASRPLTKISTVFEMALIGRKNKEEEPKDFNRTARGFAAP
ncbi:mucin-2 isoform X2 [Hypomesus transpacificus]|uniref:mucin-2 isoform X2 n=1 Tax=Hypomesus transpacificus TaxID=137520 RepID=UPI001F077D9D|nr:mucin-2 isoform X2 [Hypomesus transpacificus]